MHRLRILRIALCFAGAVSSLLVLIWLAGGSRLLSCPVGFPRAHRAPIGAAGQVHLRWSRDCLYAQPNFGSSRLHASGGAVALLGSDGFVPLERLLVLDSKDGSPLWRSARATITAIASDDDAFYLGSSLGAVERRSPVSGDTVWVRYAMPSRRIFSIHTHGPWVYAYANPDRFALLHGDDGHRVDAPVARSLVVTHLILPGLAVGDSLRAEDLDSGSIRWSLSLGGAVNQPPFVVGDVLIARIGWQVGHVVGMDLLSGAILWRSEAPAVSNIAVLNDRILFLDREGALHLIDHVSGRGMVILRYEGGALRVASESMGTVGGYYLAADSGDGSVFVYLGDSGQLDAFTVHLRP